MQDHLSLLLVVDLEGIEALRSVQLELSHAFVLLDGDPYGLVPRAYSSPATGTWSRPSRT